MIELVHESSSLGLLEGDQVVYVARATAKRVMSIGLSVGSRFPAYCTSMGRMLLSGLSEPELTAYLRRNKLVALTPKTVTDKGRLLEIIGRVRSDGFALNDQELELGHRSIAVPVKDRRGQLVAGMNIGCACCPGVCERNERTTAADSAGTCGHVGTGSGVVASYAEKHTCKSKA